MSSKTKKKTTKMDGPRTNLSPTPLTPSSVPATVDSPHEGTEVRLEPQHEPRPPSVQPVEKIRETFRSLRKRDEQNSQKRVSQTLSSQHPPPVHRQTRIHPTRRRCQPGHFLQAPCEGEFEPLLEPWSTSGAMTLVTL